MLQSIYSPNALRECPFDANHKIRACKWIEHVAKCKKSNPEKARDFETCPFNASHVIHKNDLISHINVCPNKLAFEAQHLRKTYGQGDTSVPLSTSSTSSNTTQVDDDWD